MFKKKSVFSVPSVGAETSDNSEEDVASGFLKKGQILMVSN